MPDAHARRTCLMHTPDTNEHARAYERAHVALHTRSHAHAHACRLAYAFSRTHAHAHAHAHADQRPKPRPKRMCISSHAHINIRIVGTRASVCACPGESPWNCARIHTHAHAYVYARLRACDMSMLASSSKYAHSEMRSHMTCLQRACMFGRVLAPARLRMHPSRTRARMPAYARALRVRAAAHTALPKRVHRRHRILVCGCVCDRASGFVPSLA
jgi:hypothetical protein